MIRCFFVYIFITHCFFSYAQKEISYTNNKYADKLKQVSKQEYLKNKESGFKFPVDYPTNLYFSNKEIDTILPFIQKQYPSLLTIYSKDSIKLNGINKNYIVSNFTSENSKLNKRFKILNIVNNKLFVNVEGYEWWETIMISLKNKKVTILPNLPFFIDTDKMIIFNHYYGEEEFYYKNLKNGIDFGFSIDEVTFDNYFIYDQKIYFKVISSDKKIKYYSVSLNDLTQNK